MSQCINKISVRKPRWLRRSLPTGPEYEKIRNLLKGNELTTVCQEAKCPNQFECYGKGTATFMILGDNCTRNCRFCAVGNEVVGSPDPEEPGRVAKAVVLLSLRYAVVTSVTRDDLADGGAQLFAETIYAIRKASPETLVEVLIPDLQGDRDSLGIIMEAKPDVLNHNMETVVGLYPKVRPQAQYQRSLDVLAFAKEMCAEIPTKTGIMVGLGETFAELEKSWQDLLQVGCNLLTMGQYLQPSANHLAVERFVPPEEFEKLKEKALALGFAGVASGPFVRSSYKAEKLYRKALLRMKQ